MSQKPCTWIRTLHWILCGLEKGGDWLSKLRPRGWTLHAVPACDSHWPFLLSVVTWTTYKLPLHWLALCDFLKSHEVSKPPWPWMEKQLSSGSHFPPPRSCADVELEHCQPIFPGPSDYLTLSGMLSQLLQHGFPCPRWISTYMEILKASEDTCSKTGALGLVFRCHLSSTQSDKNGKI